VYLYIEEESDLGYDEYVIKDTSDGSYETYTKEELLQEMSSGVKFIGLPFSGKQANLNKAKAAENDEFYTQMSDIEAELKNYDPDIFKDKVIYLPADVALQGGRFPVSEFVNYFKNNAETLDFKELIASCLLDHVEQSPEGYNCYSYKRTTEGYKSTFSHLEPDLLHQSGDFRSKECTEILKKADIVVTNPPFSLFREFIAWLKQDDGSLKPCIIVSNKNAITYKEVFPLIRDDNLWVGSTSLNGGRWMILPPDHVVESSKVSIKTDSRGNRIQNVAGVCWFTNLPHSRRAENMLLTERYYEEDGTTPLPDAELRYPKYDNYDAINVDKVNQIPRDYYGVMGVPITFLDKYNPDQFEIIGGFNAHTCPHEDGGYVPSTTTEYYDKNGNIKRWNGPTVNKKTTYYRICIRRKQPKIQSE